MIWGRTTHMGCGWIQFPVEDGSKKFDKIYPEGEFENFFVCNYGVGGNVPGEPVYRDRFYKTPFRPKTFRINFRPLMLDKFPPKKNHYEFT
jgi:hypothetical protein